MKQRRQWLPVADMMTGLFVIFLFIALLTVQGSRILEEKSYRLEEIITEEKDEQNSYEKVHSDIQRLKEEICSRLKDEFRYNLKKWNAGIDCQALVFWFKGPESLFESGDASLKTLYKERLSIFFPRYLRVLRPYFEEIREVKIEGHTSSKWEGVGTEKDRYLKNMKLSQARTQSVLEYLILLPIYNNTQEQWVRKHITTHGFSSAHIILNEKGSEDETASRRVDFKIIVDEAKIIRVLGGS